MDTTTAEKARIQFYEPVPRQRDGAGFDRGRPTEVVEFHFNPKEYSFAAQSDWKIEAKKGAVEAPQYTGCKPMTMNVEVFLDGTERGPGAVASAIATLLESVRPTAGSKDHPSPPLAVFSWKSAKPFSCIVKSVSVSVTMFTPNGEPLRATCKLSLVEYAAAPPRTNPTSGAERSVKAHRVRLGDTLASIAADELGNPTLWRAIAATNRLEDPFSLVVGTELLIPSRADVPELA